MVSIPAGVPQYRWKPEPRQLDALMEIVRTPEDEYLWLGYGGAAGGGKTNLLAQSFIELALQAPGSKNLIGRNHMVDLRTTTLAEFDKCLPSSLLYKRYDSTPVYRQIRDPRWPEGVVSTVFFRGIEDAESHIGSEEFGWVGIEEAHECKGRDIRYLFGRLRHAATRKRGMILCFNPFVSYVTDIFMGKAEPLPELRDSEGNLLKNPVRKVFVPAKIRDNSHLPSNYEAMLRVQYANDPYYLKVLLEGEAGVVPNAVYGQLNDGLSIQALRKDGFEGVRFVRLVSGWDWGTSDVHRSAGVLLGVDSEGKVWVLDAWESALGSSYELQAIAETWFAFAVSQGVPITAAYDRSQGSLADPLFGIFGANQVVKGVRDVDGRIRVGRGLVASFRLPFNWRSAAVRDCWRYLTLYHRDDEGKIVEKQDDMVDAFHYAAYEAEHPAVLDRPGDVVLNWETR